MKNEPIYVSMDVHARQCTIGVMDSNGEYYGSKEVTTSESSIIGHVTGLPDPKVLSLEEGPMSYWIAQQVSRYFLEVMICDPHENFLISRSSRKGDGIDCYQLCRLHRLGELKKVYHPTDNHRAVFKAAVQEYGDLRRHQVRLKSQIKARYRQWGVFDVSGKEIFNPEKRQHFLAKLSDKIICRQLERSYALLDEAVSQQKDAFAAVKRIGRRYPEIKLFKGIPGIGDYCAHGFSSFVWDPNRFATKQKLWRYARLGITDRTSDGKPLGFQRLDRSGNSELKDISFIAFRAVLRSKDNEIAQFYNLSLHRTNNQKHARLNTQRKILAVMLGMWKRMEPYNPEYFQPE